METKTPRELAAAAAAARFSSADGGGDSSGVDPSMAPELATALRISMEEASQPKPEPEVITIDDSD